MTRILVIDDEHDLQRVLAYNLKNAGHDVDVAERGRDGIELIAKRRPELVILDLCFRTCPGTESAAR